MAGAAWGQSCFSNLNFSLLVDMYDNSTQTSAPTLFYNAVTFQGSVVMNASCGTATHTPSVYNVLNGVGGWHDGNAVCPNCFEYANDTKSIAFSESLSATTTTEAKSTCSRAGVFDQTPAVTSRDEWAKVQVHNLLAVGDVPNSWVVETYCTSASTPPDFTPTYVTDNSGAPLGHAYYGGATWCTRSPDTAGTSWHCDKPTTRVYYVAAGDPKPDCTRRDAGKSGFAFDWATWAGQVAVQLYYDFHGYIQ
jgi:hypothetical protein